MAFVFVKDVHCGSWGLYLSNMYRSLAFDFSNVYAKMYGSWRLYLSDMYTRVLAFVFGKYVRYGSWRLYLSNMYDADHGVCICQVCPDHGVCICQICTDHGVCICHYCTDHGVCICQICTDHDVLICQKMYVSWRLYLSNMYGSWRSYLSKDVRVMAFGFVKYVGYYLIYDAVHVGHNRSRISTIFHDLEGTKGNSLIVFSIIRFLFCTLCKNFFHCTL